MELQPISHLVKLIEAWADNKGLLVANNAPNQFLKFLEEVGETSRAILKNDVPEIKDGFGDIAVTIIIYSKQVGVIQDIDDIDWVEKSDFRDLMDCFIVGDADHDTLHKHTILGCALSVLNDVCNYYGYDLEECLNLAWNVIKNRTGKTENGIFKKD
jgi:hypothetical protein